MRDNEMIVQRFVQELWNERKLDVADIIFDEECQTNQLQSGTPAVGVPRGPAAIKTHIEDWLAGFPDLKLTIEQMFSDGDRVVSQIAMDGTHAGEWMGMRATGKTINTKMIVIQRIRSGKIVEDWVIVESLGLLQQLGALASTEEILTRFVQRQETSV